MPYQQKKIIILLTYKKFPYDIHPRKKIIKKSFYLLTLSANLITLTCPKDKGQKKEPKKIESIK